MLEEGIVTDDTSIESDAWKNLMFMFDGRSIFGHHVHASEEAARKAAQEGKELCAYFVTIDPDYAVVERNTKAHLYYCREYSHSFQIPWGKK